MVVLEDNADVVGLRERKRLRTERDLRDAALRLVLERGFDHVTADDIASAAEVSKTTFYRYFDSKEDVLLGRSGERTLGLKAALDRRPRREPTLTAVRNAIMEFVNSFEIDRDRALAMARVIRDTPALRSRNLDHIAELEVMLRDFVAVRLAGRPDVELRSRVVAAIIVSTVRATLDYWRDRNCEDDLAELMGIAMAMLAEKRAALVPSPRHSIPEPEC